MINKINLAVHQGFYQKSLEGYRKLGPHKSRFSKVFGGCSHEIFWGKIFKEPEPGNVLMPRMNKNTFVLEPYMGAALAGTMLHEGTQKILKSIGEYQGFEFIEAEKYVVIKRGRVEIDGHVDLVYMDGIVKMICDIKTLSPNTFKSITSDSWGPPDKYWVVKKLKSKEQANGYACVEGVDVYSILWLNRDNLRFKLDVHHADKKSYEKYIEMFLEVDRKVEEYQNGDDGVRPALCGIQLCQYCDHRSVHCPGLKLLKEMGF
jgi:hypothetical protein